MRWRHIFVFKKKKFGGRSTVTCHYFRGGGEASRRSRVRVSRSLPPLPNNNNNNGNGQTSRMSLTPSVKTQRKGRGHPRTLPFYGCWGVFLFFFFNHPGVFHRGETSSALLCDWGAVDIPPLQDPDGGVMAAVFKLSYGRGQESE